MSSSQTSRMHAEPSIVECDSDALEWAYNAKLAPLATAPWSIVCAIAFLELLEVFGYDASTPADQYSAGQWLLNVVIHGLLLPLPMFVGVAIGARAVLRGARHVGRSAVRLNATLVVIWWLLVAWNLASSW